MRHRQRRCEVRRSHVFVPLEAILDGRRWGILPQEPKNLELAKDAASVDDVCAKAPGNRERRDQDGEWCVSSIIAKEELTAVAGVRRKALSPRKTLVIFLMASFLPVSLSWAALQERRRVERWRGETSLATEFCKQAGVRSTRACCRLDSAPSRRPPPVAWHEQGRRSCRPRLAVGLTQPVRRRPSRLP